MSDPPKVNIGLTSDTTGYEISFERSFAPITWPTSRWPTTISTTTTIPITIPPSTSIVYSWDPAVAWASVLGTSPIASTFDAARWMEQYHVSEFVKRLLAIR